MRSAQISFKNKKVVIIGGGNQACKKANDFLKEEAKVQVIAKHFHTAILEEVRVYKEYEESDLLDAFLVYACTDDKKLNQRIVVEANKRNILSANVHQDEEATYHPFYTTEFENMQLAYSTKGAAPAYLKHMEKEFAYLYEKQFHDILGDLRIIREYVLASKLDHKTRNNFLKKVADLSFKEIHFYKRAIEEKKALVLIFHGNEQSESINHIENLITKIKIPCIYALLKMGTQHSLEDIKVNLSLLDIDVKYQPMFLEEGYCFRKMNDTIEGKSEKLLFDEEIIEKLKSNFLNYKQTLLVLHDSKEKKVKKLLQTHLNKNIKVMELQEEIPLLNIEEEVYLVGLFILSGKHLVEDVLSEKGIYGKLVEKGYNVIKEQRNLIEMNLFEEKINKIYK